MIAGVERAIGASVADSGPARSSHISPATVNARPLGADTLTDSQHVRLTCIVRLLEMATQTLLYGDKEAYRCVAKAAALLEAECRLGAGDGNSANKRDYIPAWKLSRVSTFIDQNLDRPIRIGNMASMVHLSTAHFSRAFRLTVGETPSAFVARRRIERAQRLILHTEKPLAEIALECGLVDQSHLTKVFRRLVGLSPGRWRRLQRGVADEVDGSRFEPMGEADGGPREFDHRMARAGF
jgi:AraC family transcriptional regulator